MGSVDLFIFQQLHDAVLEQNIEAVYNYLQHPTFEFQNVFDENREWYFVVIENILEKLIKAFRKSAEDKYTSEHGQNVRNVLDEAIKQANIYALRERSLENAVNEVNTAIILRDPLTTISVLMKQNKILNNMPEYLLSMTHDNNSTDNTKIESLAVLLQQELETAVLDKGQGLNVEELSSAIEILENVVQLNDATENGDFEKVYEILTAPAAMWENVVCMNKISERVKIANLYLQRLQQKLALKIKSCGRHLMLRHSDVQYILDEIAIQWKKEGACNSWELHGDLKIESAETEDTLEIDSNNTVSVWTSEQGENNFRGAFEQPPQVAFKIPPIIISRPPQELSEASPHTSSTAASSSNSLTNPNDFIDRLEEGLAPSRSFNLWKLLDQMNSMGFLSLDRKPIEMVEDRVDLYLIQLKAVRPLTLARVTWAVGSAHLLQSKVESLGQVLTLLNKAISDMNVREIFHQLKRPDLALSTAEEIEESDLMIYEESILNYAENLCSMRKEKIENSKGKSVKPLGSILNLDVFDENVLTNAISECILVTNCNWLFTHLPLTVKYHEGRQIMELVATNSGIPFYYNIKDSRIVWSSSYFTETPGCLDPALLNREEIISVVQNVNDTRIKINITKVSSVIDTQSYDVTGEALEAIHNLARAYLIRKSYRDIWGSGGTMNQKMELLAVNNKGMRGVTRLQAIWRSYIVRKNYYIYLASLMEPNLVAAGRTILTALRRRRARIIWTNLLVFVFRLRKSVIKVQALWRGYWLRKMLSSIYVSALQYAQSTSQVNSVYFIQKMCALFMDSNHKKYKNEISCLLAAKSIPEKLLNLEENDKEITHVDSLIGAFVQSRSRQKKGKRIICIRMVEEEDIKQLGELPNKISPLQNYSGMLFLMYTQPDYWARLLVEIPSQMIWRDVNEAYPETLIISNLGIMLERMVLCFFRFGRTAGDEARLLFLITRALHLQILDHESVKAGMSRGVMFDVIRSPCPMALRLTITLAHTRRFQEKEEHCKMNLQHEKLGSLNTLNSPEGDSYNSNFNMIQDHIGANQFPVESPRLRVDGRVETHANAYIDLSLPNSVSSSQEFEDLDEYEEEGADSYDDDVKEVVPDELRQRKLGVKTLSVVAKRFFSIFFSEAGKKILPYPLCFIIRELYLLLRFEFPKQPAKEHIKYIGLHLVYRYLQTIVVTPNAFDLFTNKKYTKNIESEQKRRHQTLISLSRILYFVVINKGFPEPFPRCSSSTRESVSPNFGRHINPLIKVWHSQFIGYVLNIVESTSPLGVDGAGNDRQATQKWIETIPGLIRDCDGSGIKWRGKEEDNEARKDRGQTISLIAEELAEMHRLVATYRSKMAPDVSDPLHAELHKLPPQPDILYRTVTPSTEPAVKHILPPFQTSSSNAFSSSWSKPNTLTMIFNSRLEDYRLKKPLAQEDKGSSRLTNYNDDRISPANGDDRTVFKESQPNRGPRLQRCFRFCEKATVNKAVCNSDDLVLSADTSLDLRLIADSTSSITNACLYAASAVNCPATDCFGFLHRACHVRVGWRRRIMSEDHSRHKNCPFCIYEQNVTPWSLPASFAYGWSECVSNGKYQLLCLPYIPDQHQSAPFSIRRRSLSLSMSTTDDDRSITSTTPALTVVTCGEVVGSSAASQEIGRLWIMAKQQLINLFKSTAWKQDVSPPVRPVWMLTSSSSVKLVDWVYMLREWTVRQTHITRANKKRLQFEKEIENACNKVDNDEEDDVFEDDDSCVCAIQVDAWRLANPIVTVCQLNKRLRDLSSLQANIDLLQTTMGRIQALNQASTHVIWHVLLTWVARDLFHMNSLCRQRKWTQVQERLHAILDEIEKESKSRKERIACFISFLNTSLQPCQPIKSIYFGSKASLRVSTASVSSKDLVKYGILAPESLSRSQHPDMRNMRFDIQYLQPAGSQTELLTYPPEMKNGSEITAHFGWVTNGHFLLRLFHLGMQIEREEEVSLVNLLAAQLAGQSEIHLFLGITFSLTPFIGLLIRKFYIDSR